MDLIVKVKSYRNLDNYIKMGANAFLFGIKDFSINSLTNLNIRKLKKIGCEIYIITGRDNGDYSDPYNMTVNWLKKYNIY